MAKATKVILDGSTQDPKDMEALQNEQSQIQLEEVLLEASKLPIAKVSPQEIKKDWHTPKEVSNVITTFAEQMGIDPPFAFIAIALLFLKGAANKGTPNTMSVTITDTDGIQTEVKKDD